VAGKGRVDPGGQCAGVPIRCRGKNAAMGLVPAVKALVIPAIEGHNNTSQGKSGGQDHGIRRLSVTVILRRQHVMPALAQLLNHGPGEVFIGLEQHPALLLVAAAAFLIFTDVPADFFNVRGGIFPGRGEVCFRQLRIGNENLRVGCALSAEGGQRPDRDAMSLDTGAPPTNAGRLADAACDARHVSPLSFPCRQQEEGNRGRGSSHGYRKDRTAGP